MSNSSLVDVKVPAYSGNYTKGRSGKKISEITIHHMAGVLTPEQCGKVFQKVGRKGSSHYGIGSDGRIGLYVDEKNTAWTNSNWEANCRAVTIETSNSKTGGNWEVSDKALNSLIELIADIARRNNLGKLVKGKNLTWHRMYSKTTCPGDYLLSKMDYIVEEVNKILTEKEKKGYTGKFPSLGLKGYLKQGDKGTQVGRLQEFLNWCINAKLTVDKSFGPATLAAVKKYQKEYGLEVDGFFGPACLKKAKTIKK